MTDDEVLGHRGSHLLSSSHGSTTMKLCGFYFLRKLACLT